MIMLTANAISGVREEYLKEGFDDFVSKPIVPKYLDEIVLRYLPKRLVSTEEKAGAVVCAETSKKEEETGVKEQLKKALPEIDFEVADAYCGGDEAFYVELLRLFSGLQIKKELDQCLEKGNLEEYCVHVHGFKNNAYSIGATALGDLAYKMEQMTREGVTTGLPELQKQLMEQYERICAKYQEVVGK